MLGFGRNLVKCNMLKTGNIFDSIPSKFNDEVFGSIVDKDGIKIERILSAGHTSPEQGWYDQDQDEWVIVIQGGATIEFDDGRLSTLEQGDYINIPSRTKHKVVWTDPEIVTVWLAVFY